MARGRAMMQASGARPSTPTEDLQPGVDGHPPPQPPLAVRRSARAAAMNPSARDAAAGPGVDGAPLLHLLFVAVPAFTFGLLETLALELRIRL